MHLSRGPAVVYGDITGDRRSEAAVNVQCYKRRRHRWRTAGLRLRRVRGCAWAPNQHRHRHTAEEPAEPARYALDQGAPETARCDRPRTVVSAGDATCCPSGTPLPSGHCRTASYYQRPHITAEATTSTISRLLTTKNDQQPAVGGFHPRSSWVIGVLVNRYVSLPSRGSGGLRVGTPREKAHGSSATC